MHPHCSHVFSHLKVVSSLLFISRGDFPVFPGCFSHPPGAARASLPVSSPSVQPEFHVQTLTVKLKTFCPLPTPKVNMAHETSQEEQLGIKFSFESPSLLLKWIIYFVRIWEQIFLSFSKKIRQNFSLFPPRAWTLFVGNKSMDLLAGNHINYYFNSIPYIPCNRASQRGFVPYIISHHLT